MKKYDILNGANDGLATVEAKSAREAVKIWDRTMNNGGPLEPKGVHAVLVQEETVPAQPALFTPTTCPKCGHPTVHYAEHNGKARLVNSATNTWHICTRGKK